MRRSRSRTPAPRPLVILSNVVDHEGRGPRHLHRQDHARAGQPRVEQSIKAALNPLVFAPNDAQTWVTVVAMISNFLTSLWTQGGLMGAKASEAFTVQCGLGSTMTGLDILNGYLRVQVTLQMIHPAEFIELTFTQKMQGVG